MQSTLPDFDYAYIQLDEDLKSLKIGGNLIDAPHTIPFASPTADNISHETFDSSSMVVEEHKGYGSLSIKEVNNNEMHTVGCGQNGQGFNQKEAKIPYYYFIRISPVALDVTDIQPNFNTRNNFQLVAWKSPEGRINANVTCDRFMEFVDPGKDGVYMIQCLNRYMEMHGKGLFLYIRAPDNNEQLGEIGEHLIEMCALIGEFQEFFEVMDVAWLPV